MAQWNHGEHSGFSEYSRLLDVQLADAGGAAGKLPGGGMRRA